MSSSIGWPNYVKTICPKCGGVDGIHKDRTATAKCYDCGTHPIITSTTDEQYYLMTPDERKEWDAYMREKHVVHSDVFDAELYAQTLDGDFERRMEIETEKREEMISDNNQIKCPKCGSTAVTAGQRGFNIITGFIGSGATVNRCAKCGYKWKP